MHIWGVIILEFTSGFTTEAHGGEGTCLRLHSWEVWGSWVQLTAYAMFVHNYTFVHDYVMIITDTRGKPVTYIFYINKRPEYLEI